MHFGLKEFRLESELRPNFLVADATRVDLDEGPEHATCLDEIEEVL
jgi:hypothetical protein